MPDDHTPANCENDNSRQKVLWVAGASHSFQSVLKFTNTLHGHVQHWGRHSNPRPPWRRQRGGTHHDLLARFKIISFLCKRRAFTIATESLSYAIHEFSASRCSTRSLWTTMTQVSIPASLGSTQSSASLIDSGPHSCSPYRTWPSLEHVPALNQ
ncbi:hypothetical protein K491DRAFT_500552 [Lophiostoma macrostomum CBS 122681]|uniref:Uncharacterized protein n=1 Tax=Lophiostoma macrostomum CBS 122681 TaxID=1314788 RepID=A0A6A6T1R4_9PLEO|nr:hypothetical protein K491DRAFT_500552 [Lophiostoma macrostomum CBS 122681]